MPKESAGRLASRSRDEGRKLEREILAGEFGPPGERFLSTRELAEIRHVSLVTAQRILVGLREKRLVELRGKTYYLTHGRVSGRSPLGQMVPPESNILGLHVTNIDTPYFSALTKAAHKSAAAAGYRLLTAVSSYKPEQEYEILNTFVDIGAVGVLSCPGIVSETGAMYNRYRLPHVFLGRKPGKAVGEAVLAQNASAAMHVAEHFIKEGYKNFGYVGMPMEIPQDPRLNGFTDGLNQAGFELPPGHVLRLSAFFDGDTLAQLGPYLQKIPKPAAIFCYNDMLAISVMQACRHLKMSIPRTVALAGFDNLPNAVTASPPLTSVSYNIEDMAETAVHLLIDQIEGGEERDATYYLEPSLIVRESSTLGPVVQFRTMQPRDMLYNVPES